jgi:hypothetical protein
VPTALPTLLSAKHSQAPSCYLALTLLPHQYHQQQHLQLLPASLLSPKSTPSC